MILSKIFQISFLFLISLLARNQAFFIEDEDPSRKEVISKKQEVLIIAEKPFLETTVKKISSIITENNCEVKFLQKYKSKKEIIDIIKNYDGIIVRSDKIDKDIINAGNKLKAIVRAGSRYDNIDLEAATKKGICVMNTPGQNANAVAELVFGLLIYGFRSMFNGSFGIELKGKKIGIHGYGNIGRNIARIAKGFEMVTYAYDPLYEKEMISKDGVNTADSAEQLYKECQIISLNIPLTKETDKYINSSLLNLMPKNGLLINVSNKNIINEEDLLKFMKENKNFYYLTDVKPDNHEKFIKMFSDRYYSTPKKMGSKTSESNENSVITASKIIVSYLQFGEVQFQINK